MTTLAHDGKSHYRADIDGLRAVAVLAVVLFHIDPQWLPGGFVGVDIFFVISGFLITGNILKDARAGAGFSWAEFYRRRALRILPVLFVVLLVSLLVGHFTLLPEDLLSLSYSALATVFSAANIYFTYFLDTSYFAADSNLQPLLHLWSLGVEEQFYLFWPALLLLLSAWGPRWLFLCALLLAVASFVLAELLLAPNPMFSYYMLPTRAGELLIGALLAIYLARGPAPLAPWLRLTLGWIGAGLIAFSLIWITEDNGFPGVKALPSTVGAALLIWAGVGSRVGLSRMLALRPLVLIGLISYSLYLWHWPVLAFYRYLFGVVEPLAGAGLFALMLALSVLSYRFVEQPMRHLRWSFKQVMLRVVLAGSAAISLVCFGLIASKGFGLYGVDSDYRKKLAQLSPAPPVYSYPYACQRARLSEIETQIQDCVLNTQGEPSILLWGDSNAAHYIGVLGAFAEHAGFAFRNIAHSSCPPLLDGAAVTQLPARLEGCLASIELVKSLLERYRVVILGGAWWSYADKSADFLHDLESTVKVLQGKGLRVVLMAQVPYFTKIEPKCAQKQLKVSRINCAQESQEIAEVPHFNQRLAELAERTGADFYDPRGELCSEKHCNAFLDGELLYFDNGHLSMEGSWALGRHIVQQQRMPVLFTTLPLEGTKSSKLKERLLEQIANRAELPVQHWHSLIAEGRDGLWRSSLPPKAKEGYVLADVHSDRTAEYRYTFSAEDLQQWDVSAKNLRVHFSFANCTQGFPLMRVKLGYAGKVHAYDLMVDCNAHKANPRGSGLQHKLVDTPFGKDVYVDFPTFGTVDLVEVSVYPAAGVLLGKYDAAGLGSVSLLNVSWGHPQH